MLVQRIAVLLEAGASPLDACRLVAEAVTGSPTGTALAVAARAESAADVPDLLAAAAGPATDPWRGVAAAWRVAVETGAPLAPALNRVATVLRALDDARRDAEVALSGPRASSRVMLALPPLGLLLGTVLGMNPVGALVGSPAGWALLAVGVLLLVVGSRWTSRLVDRARRADATAGLRFDLLALAMSGGASVPAARALVAAAWRDAGLAGDPARGDPARGDPARGDPARGDPARGGSRARPESDDAGDAQNWHDADDRDDADEVLTFADRAGVPVGALLRAEADARRADAVAETRRRAAELGTRLLLPLGLCILPAFAALGVAPVLLALISSTVVGVG